MTDVCNISEISRDLIHQYQYDEAVKARAYVKVTSPRLIQPVWRRAADVAHGLTLDFSYLKELSIHLLLYSFQL